MATRYVIRCEFADGSVMAMHWDCKSWTDKPECWYLYGRAANARLQLSRIPKRPGRRYEVATIHVPAAARCGKELTHPCD